MAEIVLVNNRGVVTIDDADLPLVEMHRWYLTRNRSGGMSYATAVGPGGRRLLMHRVITACGPGLVVDHINRNGLDNRRLNLRVCTDSQNKSNRGPIARRVGMYKGVTRRESGRYQAKITFQGRVIAIGTFDAAEEAARAYDARAVELFGDFSMTNFPRAMQPDIIGCEQTHPAASED